jgi:hypothetical protein
MKEKINPLNRSLIVSALSPDRMDIVVTKLDYVGNGNEIRHWVVKNKHNQTVFFFKRETLKDTYRFTIKINGIELGAEEAKTVTDSFWVKIDKMLHDKQKRQKLFNNVTAVARKMMSVQNGIIYDHLVRTLQR